MNVVSNKIVHADCMTAMQNMDDLSVDLTVTDIPYSEVSQKSSGLRKLDRGNADTLTFDLDDFVREISRVTRESLYVFCGTKQISKIVEVFNGLGLTTRVGVWEKTNPSPMNGSRLWVSGMEFCVFARKARSTFNVHCQKALWKHSSGRSKQHPTEKPLSLMEEIIAASSNPGHIVFDPCCGSGTTLLAAKNLGRRYLGIEINKEYYEIARSKLSLNDDDLTLEMLLA